MQTQTRAEILERLPYDSFYEAFYKVRDTLPPPLEETPEGYARRDRAVLNQIKQLVPASAIEAEFAAKSVAAGEFQLGCMREARQLAQRNPSRHDDLIAQAARMGRESRGHLASLLRVQAARAKREATREAAFQADAIEGYAGDMMLDASGGPARVRRPGPRERRGPRRRRSCVPDPRRSPCRRRLPFPPRHPRPRRCPRRRRERGRRPLCRTARRHPGASHRPAIFPRLPARAAAPRPQVDDDDWPVPDWGAQAEQYAIHYPQRARLIRHLGGLPAKCDFGPPEPELVRAIISWHHPGTAGAGWAHVTHVK